MRPMRAPPAPEWPAVLGRWHAEPVAAILLVGAVLVYTRGRRALRSSESAGSAGSEPTSRQVVAFYAGVGTLALALLSPLATYAEALLSVHMVQHLVLVLAAAPLLVAARPVGILRAGLPGAVDLAPGRRWPAIPRWLVHPVTAWLVFAATGWAVHFSPLFDLALRHGPLHGLEHALFVGSGLLFWAPVLGTTTLSHPLRLLYVALAMPQNTFLAVAISSAGEPLYPAYGELVRTWGPSLLADQRQAGGLMWVAGDIALLIAVLAVAAAWGGAERREDGDEEPEAAPPELSEGRAGRPPSPRTAG
jgi:putative membrane protein